MFGISTTMSNKKRAFPLFITRLHTYLCRGVVYPQTRNNVIIYLLAEAQPCQWLHHNGTLHISHLDFGSLEERARTLATALLSTDQSHFFLSQFPSPLPGKGSETRGGEYFCLFIKRRGRVWLWLTPLSFFLRQTICQNWWRIMRRGCERSEGNWRNFFFNDYKHGNNKKICEALKKMLT